MKHLILVFLMVNISIVKSFNFSSENEELWKCIKSILNDDQSNFSEALNCFLNQKNIRNGNSAKKGKSGKDGKAGKVIKLESQNYNLEGK